MTRFHRHDNLQVVFGPKPGRGVCLEFVIDSPAEGQTEVLEEIKAWISTRVQWTNHPHHAMVKASHPFIQSTGPGYLLLEFWSQQVNQVVPVILLMMGRFEFNVDWQTSYMASVKANPLKMMVEDRQLYSNLDGTLQLVRDAHSLAWILLHHGCKVDSDNYINDLAERHELEFSHSKS